MLNDDKPLRRWAARERATAMMWYYDDNNHWGWGGWLMMVSMILFWALIVIGGIAAARYFAGPRGADARENRAEDTLAQRFAHGEIDEDEYRRRLAILREHHPVPPGR
jgi:putative membrane protein